jgi:hypothetical protein
MAIESSTVFHPIAGENLPGLKLETATASDGPQPKMRRAQLSSLHLMYVYTDHHQRMLT